MDETPDAIVHSEPVAVTAEPVPVPDETAPVSAPAPAEPVIAESAEVAGAEEAISIPPEPAAPPPATLPAPSAPIPSAPPPVPPASVEHRWGRFSHAEVVAQALAKRRARTEANLQKIMAYVAKKGSVSNDEVEKLDKVVDSTAASYLKQLVSRGLLRKVGANRSTRYEKPGQ